MTSNPCRKKKKKAQTHIESSRNADLGLPTSNLISGILIEIYREVDWRVNSPRFTHIAARTHVPIYVSHATSNHETSTLYLGIVEMQQGRELRRASTQINFPPRFTWINQFSFQQLQLIKRKPESLTFARFSIITGNGERRDAMTVIP